jgi:hypothetical protein
MRLSVLRAMIALLWRFGPELRMFLDNHLPNIAARPGARHLRADAWFGCEGGRPQCSVFW